MARTIKTYADKVAREKAVKGMIDKGMTTSEIAAALGLRRQAVHAFLSLRGWAAKRKKA